MEHLPFHPFPSVNAVISYKKIQHQAKDVMWLSKVSPKGIYTAKKTGGTGGLFRSSELHLFFFSTTDDDRGKRRVDGARNDDHQRHIGYLLVTVVFGVIGQS